MDVCYGFVLRDRSVVHDYCLVLAQKKASTAPCADRDCADNKVSLQDVAAAIAARVPPGLTLHHFLVEKKCRVISFLD